MNKAKPVERLQLPVCLTWTTMDSQNILFVCTIMHLTNRSESVSINQAGMDGSDPTKFVCGLYLPTGSTVNFQNSRASSGEIITPLGKFM